MKIEMQMAYFIRSFFCFLYLIKNTVDNGIIINRPPRDGHMAFVRSPDNISIELLQKGESLPEQEPWVSMENIGTW